MGSKTQERTPRLPSSKTPLWAIVLIAGSTFLLSAGQVLLKQSTKQGYPSLFQTLLSSYFIIGFVLYVIAAFLITIALKHGDLSVLYPVIALGFIWVTAASILFLGEPFFVHKAFGVFAIVLGVSCVGRGGR